MSPKPMAMQTLIYQRLRVVQGLIHILLQIQQLRPLQGATTTIVGVGSTIVTVTQTAEGESILVL